MKQMVLGLQQIMVDNDLYPREKLNKDVVDDYRKAMDAGDEFPLITVAFFGGKNILVDGLHRYTAMVKRKILFTKCNVLENITDKKQLLEAMIKANLKHGLRYSKKDKEHMKVQLMELKYGISEINDILHLNDKTYYKTKLKLLTKKVKRTVLHDVIKHDEVKIVSDEDEQQGVLVGFKDYLSNHAIYEQNKPLLIEIYSMISKTLIGGK